MTRKKLPRRLKQRSEELITKIFLLLKLKGNEKQTVSRGRLRRKSGTITQVRTQTTGIAIIGA
jgi:hypothetical protein